MTTIRSKRSSLIELDPIFGFIPSENEENIALHMPLRSQRLQIEESDSKNLLHPSNQLYMRQLVENDLFVKYNRCEKILHTKLLRSQFDKWTAADLYARKEVKSVRRLMPDVLQLQIPDQWFYRKGLQTLYVYLWYAQQRAVKARFFHWKYVTDARRNMLAKFLARWRWKASAWKLNKMKAAQFLKKTANLVMRVRIAHWQYYYQRWLDYDLKMQMLVKMKLLFRCWKTAVQGIIQGRRKAMRRVFLLLRYKAANQHRRVQKILEKRRLRVCQYVLHMWLLLFKKHMVLRRLFSVGDRAWMFKAMNKWKTFISRKSIMPRLSQSIELQPPTPMKDEVRVSRKAVYQSGDQLVYRSVTTVHKRGCSCCNRFPVERSQPPPPPATSIHSLRDKIAWRLGVVKELDKSFQQHEEITKPLWMSDSPVPSPRNSRLDALLPYKHYQHQPDITPRMSKQHSHSSNEYHRPSSASKATHTSRSPQPTASHLYGGIAGGSSGTRRATPQKPAIPKSAVKAPKTPQPSSRTKTSPWTK